MSTITTKNNKRLITELNKTKLITKTVNISFIESSIKDKITKINNKHRKGWNNEELCI